MTFILVLPLIPSTNAAISTANSEVPIWNQVTGNSTTGSSACPPNLMGAATTFQFQANTPYYVISGMAWGTVAGQWNLIDANANTPTSVTNTGVVVNNGIASTGFTQFSQADLVEATNLSGVPHVYWDVIRISFPVAQTLGWNCAGASSSGLGLNGYTAPAQFVQLAGAINDNLGHTQAWIFFANTTLTQLTISLQVKSCNTPVAGNNCNSVGAPVPSATVIATGDTVGTNITDSNGNGFIYSKNGNAFVGNVTFQISATFYRSQIVFAVGFGATLNITLYLSPLDCIIYPNAGNTTIPASQVFNLLQSFAGQAFYQVFQATSSGALTPVTSLNPLLGNSNNYTITYPGRQTVTSDVGSYALIGTDTGGNIHCAAPFILYSGTGAAPPQVNVNDSNVLNPIQQTINGELSAANQAASTQASTGPNQNFVAQTIGFAFASWMTFGLIPNLYTIAILATIVAIVAIIRKRN